jgi:hypothetical protein
VRPAGYRPGPYQAVLVVWVDSAAAKRARLLAPSVDGKTVQKLLAKLGGLAVGEPPPAEIVQPVVCVGCATCARCHGRLSVSQGLGRLTPRRISFVLSCRLL